MITYLLTFMLAADQSFFCPEKYSESGNWKISYQELSNSFSVEKTENHYTISVKNGSWLSSFDMPYSKSDSKHILHIPNFLINTEMLHNDKKNSDEEKLNYRMPTYIVSEFLKESRIKNPSIKLMNFHTNMEGKTYIQYAFPEFVNSMSFVMFQAL